MKELGIKLCFTCEYHAQANGMDERFNASLMKTVKYYTDIHQQDWDSLLMWALFSYNITPNRSTKKSPYEILYGVKPRSPLIVQQGSEISIDSPLLNILRDKVRKDAAINMDYAQQINKFYFDKKRKPQTYRVGQTILLRRHAIPSKICKKLAYKWVGPYVILKHIGSSNQPTALLIADPTDNKVRRASYNEVKPSHSRDSDDDFEAEVDKTTIELILSDERENDRPSEIFSPPDTLAPSVGPDQTVEVDAVRVGSPENHEIDTLVASDPSKKQSRWPKLFELALRSCG